ncbi:SRPBCC family protein [Algoriphagus sp. H41]|uniref:SRPBCC family protein n=1 Tax=Algoriphagus oliviformis TaxID=2811231 RepID=A0ABS3C739_9BACT|nr:SRPBCC family protein [Algoriphagus oliviformis]MBN7812923.1 SRPBCC family protein [Algoriphagus oliviformis]
MKALKILLIILVAVVALPLLAALFISGNYDVTETIVIDKPKEEVFAYVKSLKNQEFYSKWQKMDLQMEHYFEGQDGTVGFVSGWKSQNPDVGAGEQEIIAIEEGERIDYELRFLEPFASTSGAFMTTEEEGPGKTKVSWGFTGDMEYPMNLMIPLMGMKESISADLAEGLANLKVLLENGN